MQNSVISQQTEGAARIMSDTRRLYYLDWLRVIATLGVFLFHASNVFNGTNFEVRNAESSDVILIFDTFFYPWGMPLFFLLAGAGSWFALRRRSAGQFTRERTLRLLVPFFAGALVLGSLQIYLSWSHRTQTGMFDGSLLEFAAVRLSYPFPKIIGGVGYHLWFLGFLFLYSLLALPLFIWLKGEAGRRFVLRLAGLCEHRGAILLFILPLAAVRLVLHPFSPELQNWADFFYYGAYFVLGYLLFADERFIQTIRRDWSILLGVGIAATLAGTAIGVSRSFDVEKVPDAFWEFLLWGLIVACGWCWAVFFLSIGMRYLNFDSKALRYGQVTQLPFYVVHQPVILAIAYFVVRWEAIVPFKLLVVVLGAFVASIGLVELLIKRVGALRALCGMKGGQAVQTQVVSTPQKTHAGSASVR